MTDKWQPASNVHVLFKNNVNLTECEMAIQQASAINQYWAERGKDAKAVQYQPDPSVNLWSVMSSVKADWKP